MLADTFGELKHAIAGAVRCHFEKDETVSVEDDGIGFEPTGMETPTRPKGIGLLSMRTRGELLGGAFSIESSSGYGTRVYTEVPLLTGGQALDAFEKLFDQSLSPSLAAPDILSTQSLSSS